MPITATTATTTTPSLIGFILFLRLLRDEGLRCSSSDLESA